MSESHSGVAGCDDYFGLRASGETEPDQLLRKQRGRVLLQGAHRQTGALGREAKVDREFWNKMGGKRD